MVLKEFSDIVALKKDDKEIGIPAGTEALVVMKLDDGYLLDFQIEDENKKQLSQNKIYRECQLIKVISI